MIWGVIALFVMVSIWGIIAFLGEVIGLDETKKDLIAPKLDLPTAN